MISSERWFTEAIGRDISFFTGVPCSYLTPFINAAISDERTTYVGAASEGEAVAIAAGAYLGGKKPVVMCQNSGFGNTINPLTSLSWTFRIPHLLITTWRGDPDHKDEPQHELMGQIMHQLMDAVRLTYEMFPDEGDAIAASLDRAETFMDEEGLPYGFLMKKGTVAPAPLTQRVIDRGGFPEQQLDARPSHHGPELSRRQATEIVRAALGDRCAYFATTGKLGRELFTIADEPNQFYNVGSMGCVSAIGLGVALTRPEQRVVVLDGDGSLLMKMGALATVGHYAPRNLVHVVFDNEVHESTGGQSTVSSTVDFASVAVASGYRRAWSASSKSDLSEILDELRFAEGPVLLHLKVAVKTDKNLGRPTIHPSEVAQRMRAWIADQ